MAVVCAVMVPLFAVLAVVDQRVLLGAPLWFKPLKFAISFALYAAVLAWMISKLSRPAMRVAGWVIVVAAVIELGIIDVQAARGVRSHFNNDNPTGELLFSIMGATIVVLWLATLAVALRFLRDTGSDRVTTTAIRLGLGVGLVGLGVAFLMTIEDAHAVGVADGGPGLFLLGWSTTGGDLRVPHFVGIHALQILPLIAAFTTRLHDTARVRLLYVGAAGYLGLIVLLTWQALRAQPLFSPDALTLSAFALLVLGVAAGALASIGARTRPAAT